MKTFQPECTLPPAGPTFVGAASLRSTMDIIWSCLGVILLSTWSVIHLDVPPQIHARTRSQRFCKQVWLVWRKTKWMLLACLVPEIILAFAFDGLGSARRSVRAMKRVVDEHDTEWTLSHAFFADMGGYVIKFHDEAADNIHEEPPEDVATFYQKQARAFRFIGSLEWKPYHIHCQAAASMLRDRADYDGGCLLRLCGNPWTLNAAQMAEARSMGIISQLPQLSANELLDKSKSDSLVKFLALSQLAWLVLQLVVRIVQGRPISTLEILAVCYAVCACVTYVVLWSQPKDVSHPSVVQADRFPTAEEIWRIDWCEDGSPADAGEQSQTGKWRCQCSFPLPSSPLGWAMLLGGSIFGALLQQTFRIGLPTRTETMLLIGSLAFLAFSPWLPVVAISFIRTRGQKHSTSMRVLGAICCLPVVGRLFLIAETFRAVYFLPPAAYTSTWAMNLPHL